MKTGHIFIYGPPGSGKSHTSRLLAKSLALPLIEMDDEIENQAGIKIADIFDREGEAGFRQRETEILRQLHHRPPSVVALGGGALLASANAAYAREHGTVICLCARLETLQSRLRFDGRKRPLLDCNRGSNLEKLLSERREHYHSFDIQLPTDELSPAEVAWEIQTLVGRFQLHAMGSSYPVIISEGISDIPEKKEWLLPADSNAYLLADQSLFGLYKDKLNQLTTALPLHPEPILIPPGETSKSLSQLQNIWESLLSAGADRNSLLVVFGGGVIGDLGGFAAATFMRGISWVNIPTSLVAQVDAGLGGKTAINLPAGKNLVGAFYPPRAVWIDPLLLHTLPPEEFANGMAEVIKHAILGDEKLYGLCQSGPGKIRQELKTCVRRAVAVKIKIIEQDPYERGLRQVLNFGHTIGHALENTHNFRLSHGQAVAIGMAVETYISEQIGLAETGLAKEIVGMLNEYGLPHSIPEDISIDQILHNLSYDKKRNPQGIPFALPVRIGEVRHGIQVPDLKTYLEAFRRER
jgi:3-dehydroquinate synthase/shikimate kinase/3-dehydroquinate synthase